MRRIPFGRTTTFLEIARAIGAPRAVRAVGNACSQNPLEFAIPCHRVLRTDGSYSGGSEWELAPGDDCSARGRIAPPKLYLTAGENHEARDHSGRASVDLPRAMESADLCGHASRRHYLRLGLPAVRPEDWRSRRRADRAADGARARAIEALRRDRRLVVGTGAEVQRLLHFGRQVRRRQRDLRPLFPEGPAGAHLHQRPRLAGVIRHRDRLHRGPGRERDGQPGARFGLDPR